MSGKDPYKKTLNGECMVVRVDAGPDIGSGHLMRCLALAQVWQDSGGRAVFASAMTSPGTELRLRSEGIETVPLPVEPGSAEDAMRTIDLAREMEARWVVADGYHFGADYQRAVKNASQKLLFIDDNGHATYYCADIVLNQNIHAHAGLYENREANTRLLLGTRYALLRREFLRWREWKREFPEVARKILVTMGGSDPNNATLKALRALQRLEKPNVEIRIAMGGGNPSGDRPEFAAGKSSDHIRVMKNTADMSEVMAWADIAIAAGGSTNWELAFLGVPTCILVVADNQVQIARALDEQGIAINQGWVSEVSEAKLAEIVDELIKNKHSRMEMSNRGRNLVDGDGSKRVVAMLLVT